MVLGVYGPLVTRRRSGRRGPRLLPQGRTAEGGAPAESHGRVVGTGPVDEPPETGAGSETTGRRAAGTGGTGGGSGPGVVTAVGIGRAVDRARVTGAGR